MGVTTTRRSRGTELAQDSALAGVDGEFATMPPGPSSRTMADELHGRAGTGVRVAYLLSRYPAISHTFFFHEVIGLRNCGVHVETISINAPDRLMENLPEGERREAERTFYVQESKAKAAVSLIQTLLQHPAVVARGFLAWVQVKDLSLRQRGFWLFYLAEALLVGRFLRERQIEHLHVHFGGAVASVGMLAAAAWRIPYSLTIHGPEELLDLSAYHVREKTAAARFVLCISDFCRSQLYQITPPQEWPKFHVARLGVDTAKLRPEWGRDRSEDSGLHIVCTGRLVPAKGHRVLLQAVAALRRRGASLRLTMIGAGPERASLGHFVAEHDLQDTVRFTGALSHPETLSIVREADLFVLASFAEGIPVALMEAMALGVPCISTGIAGIPELITQGENGLLVPPGNVPALTAAMQQLLDDGELRDRMGRSARRRVERDYNLASNVQVLADIFAGYVVSRMISGEGAH